MTTLMARATFEQLVEVRMHLLSDGLPAASVGAPGMGWSEAVHLAEPAAR